MSMVFIDGFDHYSERLEKWDTISQSQSPFIDNGFGRFINGSMYCGGGSYTGTITKRFLDSVQEKEMIWGFAFYFSADALTDFRFRNVGGSDCGSITIAAPDITLNDKNDSTVATAVSAVTAATWQYVEFRVKSHATLGEIECRVNNVLVASATGIDTRGSDITQIGIQSHTTGSGNWIDDMYVLSTSGAAPQNTFIGDVRVTPLLPKADGIVNNFTPSDLGGNNYSTVDEPIHNRDVDYVESGLIGAHDDFDNFDFADLGLTPGTIFGVQVVNAAKKTDAGALRYKDQMTIAGVNYDNGEEVTAGAVLYKMSMFVTDTDPSDSAPWTETKVANVGSGFEITFREI